MTGLVNSVIHAAALPPAGAVVQAALFTDDPQRQIADLERRLRDSESAYDAVCEALDQRDTCIRRLLHENKTLQIGLEAARRVNAVCACGLVRR